MSNEWLEADGLGGFASGSDTGIRTRRYHGLLITATTPPTGRVMLVNGVEAWIETPAGSYALSSHAYTPDVIHPDGKDRINSFDPHPWPRWTYALEDGTRIEHEIFMPKGASVVVLVWRLATPKKGVTLSVQPFLSGRNYHALQAVNPHFSFDPYLQPNRVQWRPTPHTPAIAALFNGSYTHRPTWYRNFIYEDEKERGLESTEDCACPGSFRWNLSQKEAILIFYAKGYEKDYVTEEMPVEVAYKKLHDMERFRRESFPSLLHKSADMYVVDRGQGKTIIAGYPWFTDWGRDTFVSVRGLCLATGRWREGLRVLLEWSNQMSEGMMPNYFPDEDGPPAFNSADASLWFIIAVYDLIKKVRSEELSTDVKIRFEKTIQGILSAYEKGARYGIKMDDDGLLMAGEKGWPVTWMDVKLKDQAVTPRVGKAVEIQALWLNALLIGSSFDSRWKDIFSKAHESFQKKFWNASSARLYDVVEVDHQPHVNDSALRPNQIFAVGGLPFSILNDSEARAVVDTVEKHLWTPLGLRTLAPGAKEYQPRCEGGLPERDAAYHQGTVWPWLLGPFVEAWVRVRGGSKEVVREARSKFLDPLFKHRNQAGLGHVSEIADGDAPHTPRGCPFQAWSLAELIRLEYDVLE